MSIQTIELSKFTGGMSDDPRIQSDQMFQDIDGFDITSSNYVLDPIKDWNLKVDFDQEPLIDSSTARDIIFDGSNHYILTENSSGNARLIKISTLGGASPNVTDPTGTVSGTEDDFEKGSLIRFNNRAWFIDGGDHVCFYNLNLLPAGSTSALKFGVHSLEENYRGVRPVVGPTYELWIPNGKSISTIVPLPSNPVGGEPTFNSEVLKLPDDITALGKFGRNGLVGTYERENGSRAWIWNGIDADTTDNYYIGPDEVVAFATVGGTPIAFLTKNGETSIYFLQGGGFELFMTIPEEMRGEGRIVIQRGGKAYFITDNSLWVLGAKNTRYEFAITRIAKFRMNNNKTGETADLDNMQIFSIFQDNYGIGVIAEHETEESSGQEGIYYFNDDDDYFYEDATVVTQKFKYRDIGQHHQLKFITESIDWGVDPNASIKIEYRVDSDDEADYQTICTGTKSDIDNFIHVKRKDDRTPFDIGQETEFRITSNNGAKIKEHKFGLSPRMTRFNQ